MISDTLRITSQSLARAIHMMRGRIVRNKKRKKKSKEIELLTLTFSHPLWLKNT